MDLRWLVLALTAGILLVFTLETLPSFGQLTLLAALAGLPWRGRSVVAVFVLGVLLCSWQGQRYLDERWPADRHGEVRWLEGTIVSLPERQQIGDRAPNWRFEFSSIESSEPQRVRVSWYRGDIVPAGGQCWKLQLRLRTPRGSANPGAFDYEAWLLRERIVASASVIDAKPCTDRSFSVSRWILELRQRVVDDINAAVGQSRGAAMLAALAVGDTTGLKDADWQLFRETGTTHLIAISGFNLGIVVAFSFLLLRWLWSLWPRLCLIVPAQRIALIGSGPVAVFYAMLAGFEPPVLRALIMLLMLILAALLHRLQQPTRILGCAWALVVLLDPFAVLSPGLWLSFGAVLAILYVSSGRLRRAAGWKLALQVQWMLSLALIPMTLYFFGGFAWLATLVNLLAVPVFTLLTPLVLLAVLALTMTLPGAEWLVQQLAWSFESLVSGLEKLLALAPLAWISANPPAPALLLGALGSLLLFLPRGAPLALRMLALPCLAALALPRQQTVTALDVVGLDVGQGTAVVVRTAHHTLLVDAGPALDEGFDAGRSIVVPYLLARGITRLDALVVSHDDNDHAGGVAAVRQLLPVARSIGTADGEPCKDGLHWQWDGVDFRVLHPADADGSANNRSCVLKISGPFSVLLPGDIEHAAEQRLLRDHGDELAADVLFAPHHGSRSSSTVEFVAVVDPQIVIHSAAWRSRYGHPHPSVVARYAALGSEQHTTGVGGAIEIRLDGDGRLEVGELRRLRRRWWQAPPEP